MILAKLKLIVDACKEKRDSDLELEFNSGGINER